MTDEYEPLLLGTPQLVDAYWPYVAPLFERVVRKAAHGEYTADDIGFMARSGKVFIFALVNDKHTPQPERKVMLALAVEVVNYPRLPALNILAVGGSGLSLYYKKYWKLFTGWAYMNGARAIEGWVSPAMRRTSEAMGFKAVYTHMRYDLTEQDNA